MKYYIIIRGPLGIGKTTIAKKLAAKLDATHISIDSVLEEHGLDKANGRCIPAKNFIKANSIVLPSAKSALAREKIVIFDGNFYHKKQLQHIIQGLKSPHYLFTLKAPLETCIKRDSKRKRRYGKEATTAVHTLVTRFDYGIVIDTDNKTAKKVAEEIMSYLAAKRN